MAPENDQAAAVAGLQAAVDKLTVEADKLEPAFKNLVAAVKKALAALSFGTPVAALLYGKKVEGKLDRLGNGLTDLSDEVGKLLSASMPVFALIEKGFGYTNQVLPDVSATVAVARDLRPNALNVWGGTAGAAYREKRFAQQAGLQGTSSVVKDVGVWLVGVAALNAKFLIDATEPIIEMVGALVETAGELLSGLGAPFAIETLAKAAGDAVKALLNLVTNASTHVIDSISALSAAKTILNSNDPFPAKHWPQAVNR